MINRITPLLLSIMLATSAAGAERGPIEPPPDIAAMAKEAVAGKMIDPSSAQFRDLVMYPLKNSGAICGEVNSKNRYGGYVGFRRFVWMDTIVEVEGSELDERGQTPFKIMYGALCKPHDIPGPK